MPCPKNSEGFIDEGELYKLAYGKLKLPYGSLDDITPQELYWIWDGNNEAEREHFEVLTFSIFYSIRSANSKKSELKNPFAKQTDDYKYISKDKRDEEIAFIESIFE